MCFQILNQPYIKRGVLGIAALVLMTSLATLMSLVPMALKLGTGSEAYAPLASTGCQNDAIWCCIMTGYLPREKHLFAIPLRLLLE
jgi:hypothetical protein